MSCALAQLGLALAAIALLAALIGLAIASGHRGSSGQKLPERVGDWYQARAAPMPAGPALPRPHRPERISVA